MSVIDISIDFVNIKSIERIIFVKQNKNGRRKSKNKNHKKKTMECNVSEYMTHENIRLNKSYKMNVKECSIENSKLNVSSEYESK